MFLCLYFKYDGVLENGLFLVIFKNFFSFILFFGL